MSTPGQAGQAAASTIANTSFVGVVNALATAKAQFERERGGDACQMSMDRHRFRKRCERLTNGGNIHVLRVTCRHTRGAGFLRGAQRRRDFSGI